MHRFFAWLRGVRSVEAITKSFDSVNKKLTKAVTYHREQMHAHSDAAQRHHEAADAHTAEAERAQRIVGKVSALIS